MPRSVTVLCFIPEHSLFLFRFICMNSWLFLPVSCRLSILFLLFHACFVETLRKIVNCLWYVGGVCPLGVFYLSLYFVLILFIYVLVYLYNYLFIYLFCYFVRLSLTYFRVSVVFIPYFLVSCFSSFTFLSFSLFFSFLWYKVNCACLFVGAVMWMCVP